MSNTVKVTKSDLQIILQEGEGQRIEFKESFSHSIVKDIVAFANALGGKIFVGVDDHGNAKGIKITNTLKSQVVDLAKNCDPAVAVALQTMNDILIIDVEEGYNKPYQCRDGFFYDREQILKN
jgi:ATP-dependent DNA helicase RecG